MSVNHNFIKSKEFIFLSEISNILSSSLNIQDSAYKIFEKLKSNFKINKSILTRYNQIQDTFFIKVSYGLTLAEIESVAFEKWYETAEKVLELNRILLLKDLSGSFVYFGERKKKDIHANSFICLPLIIGDQKFGTLSVSVPEYSEDELNSVVRLLGIVCLMLAQELKLKKLLESEKEHLRKENIHLRHELSEKYKINNMIGKSSVMHNVYQSITQVSSSNVTVLIRGESGTGKELVAHAIHYQSPRSNGPFIRINCGAIPESLIESELFGHVKGAFTDAIETKKGKFEAANGGTIFLDEVAELSPQLQVKLLRVLQEKEITQIGALDPIKVDVRVITATNKDLEVAMEKGEMREDFYYRLNVFPINIPPLRKRQTDIMLIAEHFLEKFSKEHGKVIERISSSVIDLFYSYAWPGNIRELENCIERAVILCTEEALQPVHLPPSLQRVDTSIVSIVDDSKSLKDKVSEFEKKIILDVLHKTNGNVSLASKKLKTTQRILGYKIDKLNVDVLSTKG